MSALLNREDPLRNLSMAPTCGETLAKSANAGYTEDLDLEDTLTDRCAFAIENIL
jgi:hypothetical protein